MYNFICERYNERANLYTRLYHNIEYNGCYELKDRLEQDIDQITIEISLFIIALNNKTQENTKEIEFESSVVIG